MRPTARRLAVAHCHRQLLSMVLASANEGSTGTATRSGSCCLFVSQQRSHVAAVNQHADLSVGYTGAGSGAGFVSPAAEKAKGRKSLSASPPKEENRPPRRHETKSNGLARHMVSCKNMQHNISSITCMLTHVIQIKLQPGPPCSVAW